MVHIISIVLVNVNDVTVGSMRRDWDLNPGTSFEAAVLAGLSIQPDSGTSPSFFSKSIIVWAISGARANNSNAFHEPSGLSVLIAFATIVSQ